MTQPYSRAIHDHPQRPDGIRYRLRHDLDRVGVAIFERALEGRVARFGSRGSLLDSANRRLLGAILDNYQLGLK